MASSFLGHLSEQDVGRIMRHPAQVHNVAVIESLVDDLRSCRTFDEYDDFQRELFQYLYHREQHRSACRRCAARLARGKELPGDIPQLPPGTDPMDPEIWRIEDLVLDRICRQLRAVGDALAWKAAGYDRRYAIALSSNASPGPMAGKSGLPRELGAATSLRSSGSFGLLHDLTNCLRIGDITEFKPDGSKLIHEIKTNPNAKIGAQRKRMTAAVEAVMNGGELPGRPGNHIVIPEQRCRTHIRTLASVIESAAENGFASRPIANARALTAYSFPALTRKNASQSGPQLLGEFNANRQAAIEQAGIANVLHHVRVTSGHRNHDFQPSVVPFALFPLLSRHIALLMCDYLGFDVTVSPERLASALGRLGFTAEIPLTASNDSLVASDAVIRLRRGSRGLDLHPGALYELLIESLDLTDWARAVAEILDNPNSPPHPVLALSTTQVWR